jgi:predicted nucleic-acid-binding Zn-ribbon protein
MQDGICPKCEAKAVHVFNGTGAELAVRLGVFSAANVVYYICTSCGYVELYVNDKSDLPKIAEKYPKV